MATFSWAVNRLRVFLGMGEPPLEIVAYSSGPFFPFRLKQDTLGSHAGFPVRLSARRDCLRSQMLVASFLAALFARHHPEHAGVGSTALQGLRRELALAAFPLVLKAHSQTRAFEIHELHLLTHRRRDRRQPESFPSSRQVLHDRSRRSVGLTPRAARRTWA